MKGFWFITCALLLCEVALAQDSQTTDSTFAKPRLSFIRHYNLLEASHQKLPALNLKNVAPTSLPTFTRRQERMQVAFGTILEGLRESMQSYPYFNQFQQLDLNPKFPLDP